MTDPRTPEHEVVRQVIDAVACVLGSHTVRRSLEAGTRLADVGVRSLQVFRLIALLEDEFGVRFRDDDINVANFATPADAARMVERYLAGPGASA
jgi:acyl carrier protein